MAVVHVTESGKLYTTTLAIAEGTGHDHASVIKLVRTYIVDLQEFGPLRFAIQVGKRTHGGGSPTEYAKLSEQQASLILTYMRNSTIVRNFKKRLIKEFYTLARNQNQNADQFLDDPIKLRGLLLTYANKTIALEEQVHELTPLAKALARIKASAGSKCLTDAAKILDITPRRFFQMLNDLHWIYRRGGNGHWVAYQHRINDGSLEQKIYEFGGGEVVSQVRLTHKGIVRIANHLNTFSP
jgi:phage regulator Rha-like protein